MPSLHYVAPFLSVVCYRCLPCVKTPIDTITKCVVVIMGIVLVLMETNGPCGSQLVIGGLLKPINPKIHFLNG